MLPQRFMCPPIFVRYTYRDAIKKRIFNFESIFFFKNYPYTNMQTENLFKISTNKQYIHKHFGKVEVKCVRFGTVEFIDENNK